MILVLSIVIVAMGLYGRHLISQNGDLEEGLHRIARAHRGAVAEIGLLRTANREWEKNLELMTTNFEKEKLFSISYMKQKEFYEECLAESLDRNELADKSIADLQAKLDAHQLTCESLRLNNELHQATAEAMTAECQRLGQQLNDYIAMESKKSKTNRKAELYDVLVEENLKLKAQIVDMEEQTEKLLNAAVNMANDELARIESERLEQEWMVIVSNGVENNGEAW